MLDCLQILSSENISHLCIHLPVWPYTKTQPLNPCSHFSISGEIRLSYRNSWPSVGGKTKSLQWMRQNSTVRVRVRVRFTLSSSRRQGMGHTKKSLFLPCLWQRLRWPDAYWCVFSDQVCPPLHKTCCTLRSPWCSPCRHHCGRAKSADFSLWRLLWYWSTFLICCWLKMKFSDQWSPTSLREYERLDCDGSILKRF